VEKLQLLLPGGKGTATDLAVHLSVDEGARVAVLDAWVRTHGLRNASAAGGDKVEG